MERKIVRVVQGNQFSLEELKISMKSQILQGVGYTVLMTVSLLWLAFNGCPNFLLGLLCGMQVMFLLIWAAFLARYLRFEKQYFYCSDLSSGDEKTTPGVFSQFVG